MGEVTEISWTDHTFNAWIGCTKVSEACDHCYAETLSKRYGWAPWGPGELRSRTSVANWRKPVQWNKAAARDGVRRRVFCNSLSDVFDAEVFGSWRDDLFDLICKTPHLDWLLLTKRPKVAWQYFEPYRVKGPPSNVWLSTTVEDQKMADLRVPTLLSIPATKHFLSCEPLLGPVDLSRWLDRLDWVISGGESGPHARPPHPDWLRSLRDQCQAAGVAYHFKQWGEWAPVPGSPQMVRRGDCFLAPDGRRDVLGPSLGTELEDVGTPMRRVGKKAAGAMLDGREWREFPA